MSVYSNKLIIRSLRTFLKILPIYNITIINNEVVLILNTDFLLTILFFLKNHVYCQYKILVTIVGVDYLHKTNRFELIYELLSLRFNNRIKIKLVLNELEFVESCKHIFNASVWYENEIWDMYGIVFNNRYKLQRILTDYGFEGFPLRKDFPLCGFVEIKYSKSKKKILTESVELAQEYRTFKFISPWKN